MNQFERDIGGRPAVLQYLDGEYRVITPGTWGPVPDGSMSDVSPVSQLAPCPRVSITKCA